MSNYKKLIAAAVGFGVLVAKDYFGITIGQGTVDQFMELAVAALTLIFVERLPNETK